MVMGHSDASNLVSYPKEPWSGSKLLVSLIGDKTDAQLYFSSKICDNCEISKKSLTPVKRPQISKERISTNLDLTGSPLKPDFDVDEVFDNSGAEDMFLGRRPRGATYIGLGIKDARTALSRINTGTSITNANTWVLCTGDDAGRVVYLSSQKVEGKVSRLSRVSWDGPFRSRELAGRLERLRADHQAAGGRPAERGSCRARYAIAGGELGEAGGSASSIILETEWNRCSTIMETPPVDAQTLLRVNIVPGDEIFSTGVMFRELDQLQGLVRGLSGEGLVWSGRDQDDIPLDEQVLEVLDASRKLRPNSGVNDVTKDTELDTLLDLKSRQEGDFTDMLWTVLSRAQSFAELTDCLNLTLSTIVQEEIRPFLYSGNRSGMVGIVKSLIRGEEAVELTGSKPLLLLIEMGIEKLRRDFCHTLLTSDLASKEAVTPFMEGETLQESVDLLRRLYVVVELTLACQTYLSLPVSSLKSVVQSALARLRSEVDTLESVHLDFPLNTADIKDHLENFRPSVWQVRLGNDSVRTVLQLQVEKPEELYSLTLPSSGVAEEETTEPEYLLFTLTSTPAYQ